MTYAFKVLFNENGEVLDVEPPPGKNLICKGIAEYSSEGKKKKDKFEKKKSIDIELWELKGEPDPCVRIGGRLWCW